MKSLVFLLLLPLSLLTCLAKDRPRAADPSRALVRQANAPAARQLTQAAINQQPGAFLNEGRYEAGYLYLLSGRRVLVPGLRYHVGQRVVEVQDSLQADSTSYWPLAALRGFDLGTENDPATRRRYRPRLVHESHQLDRREAVQVLTATDAGPLVLAWLPLLLPGTASPGQLLLAGSGHNADQPLQQLSLNGPDVLHLLNERAQKVQTFARTNNLHCGVPQEVAQMLDYYNRLAVAVE
ncbi:hypothetical protein HHL22_12695 [Hymenobacter sp. RP-2-7]|uniref:DUF4369 domain-containing protein n=1 Tax=Hymenobacter polaris TaxID=2682546 RepID=A0A7Y0AEU0_9BACT|nr:hypothetical protein [Hymenobacter polaris]NML66064.1 hypothetical protein [Hymenobacter polaris]